MKTLFNLFLIFLVPTVCCAQFTISGRVLNQADTKPVAYASVFLNNATNGDKTSAKGTFLLQNVKPGSYELIVSMVGFEVHSQLITITDADVKLPDIAIYPKTIQLNEVKIKPVDDLTRDKYLQLFKNEFLGTTDLAKDCKILNPEVLDFDYNDTTGTLKASAADFLKIKNDGLGYNISYLITNFTVTNKLFFEKDFAYKGFVLFEEMEGTPAQKKHWLKARQEAFENSSAHFLRALLTNNVADEGFKVQQIAVYPNPERPADTLIKAKIKLYTGSKSGSGKDSLAAWMKKSKLNKTLLRLYKFPLLSNEIVQRTEKAGTYVLGCENDALYISYNKHKNFDKEGRLQNINDPYNTENAIISFNSRYAFFDDNGWISNPESVTFSGVWSKKRVADLLPKNYEYNGVKNIEADTGLTAMTGKLNEFAKNNPIEKVYLQTDKSNYDVFDTIWYKAYTVVGLQHQLSALSGILYTELIGPKDSVVSRQILHLISGAAWGDFVLTGAIKQGDYRLRAYTNWMRNAGAEYFFNEKIHIGGYDTAPPVKQTAVANPDVQFFPEGGELVNGLRCKVAVKSIAPGGLGKDVNGTIVDNEGNIIVDFATQHLGMGAFAFTPQSGKTYKARIKTGIGETAFDVDLPKAKEAGFILGINNSRPDSIFIKVAANEALFQQKQRSAFYVIAQSGGKVYYTAQSTLEDQVFTAAIDKKRFPSGIVQFTLFAANGEPLNERSAFIQNDDTLQLNISNPVKTFAPGQKVTLNLDVKNQSGQPVMGAFSAAVTNESMLLGDEASDINIFSSLLLTSDLKGFVEKPGYYFTNANDQTRADLDVLLLTQGYQRFEWKPILSNTSPPATYQPETSLDLAGSIKTFSGKPVPNGKISLVAVKNNFVTDTVTDAEGNFKFTNIDLPDSARMVLSAKKINNNNNVNVSIKKADYPPIIKDNSFANDLPAAAPADSVQKRAQQVADLRNRRMLKEVTIKGQKGYKRVEPDLTYSTNLNGPGHADQIIMSDDLTGCVKLSDCLTFTLRGGITIRNGVAYNPHIHGMHQSPIMAVSIDGAVSKNVNLDDIDPNIVHSVEVLSSVSTYSVYGIDIGGGVLVITTKHGGKDYATTQAASGTITSIFNGFYKAHEFYSPKYDSPQSNALAADLRSTIYWNPNILTDKDGKTTLNYYNAGTKGTYRVVIEGINDDGDLGRLVYRYKVE
jgi:hypothetical protein